MKKPLALITILFFFMLSFISCTTDNSVVIVFDDDDGLVGDISTGDTPLKCSINTYGEWAAIGSKGIAYGSGTRTDFNLITLNTGNGISESSISINKHGNFIAATQSEILYGDTSGNLSSLLLVGLGHYVKACINDNNFWVVSGENGTYVGFENDSPVFVDYVSSIGGNIHCSLNNNNQFVNAGDIMVLYGFIDNEGYLNTFSYSPVSLYYDRVWTDINEFGDFIATGSLDTLLGETDGKAPASKTMKRKAAQIPELSYERITVSRPLTNSSERIKIKPSEQKADKKIIRKVYSDDTVRYHSCAINNFMDYAASGDDYLIYNDESYSSVTAFTSDNAVEVDESGNWIAAGSDGLYYNGSLIIDGMGEGDHVSLVADQEGNFVFVTSYSVYNYDYSMDVLLDNGPVSDRYYPVSGDIQNSQWIAAGNYGILLWNY